MSEKANNQKSSHVSILLRAGVAVIACALIASKLDFKEVFHIFSNISPWILLTVLAAFVVSQIILTFRWWVFMRVWEIIISFRMAVKLTFLGLYFNNFLPGSIGGDLVRAWYVAKHTHKRMAAVISVLIDRVLALFGTIIMAVTTFLIASPKGLFIRQEKSDKFNFLSENENLLIGLSAAFLLVVCLSLLLPKVRNKLRYIFNKLMHHAKDAFLQMLQAAIIFIRHFWLAPLTLLMTFLLQGIVIISMWLVGREIGIPANLEVYFVLFPVMWVAGSVPISVAGIGIMEGGLIVLFTHYAGASVEAATALALCQRAVWIIGALPGLVVHLAGKHLPEAFDGRFSIDENK